MIKNHHITFEQRLPEYTTSRHARQPPITDGVLVRHTTQIRTLNGDLGAVDRVEEQVGEGGRARIGPAFGGVVRAGDGGEVRFCDGGVDDEEGCAGVGVPPFA